MNIVLEGPDGAGKSTLAKKIAIATGMSIKGSEGPAKSFGEINQRVIKYSLLKTCCIFDRHPCVSNDLYNAILPTDQPTHNIKQELIDEFYSSKPFIIYCRPDLEGFATATRSLETDTDEFHRHIAENYERLIKLYDYWALHNANYIYRKTDSLAPLLNAIRDAHYQTYFDDIRAFHEKYNQTYNGPATDLTRELEDFRLKFLTEELHEYVDSKTLEDKFDALIDLVYVALGTAYMHGFDFDEGWRRVHEANMKKVNVRHAGESKRGSRFDVVKPKGWKPPVLKDLVE